MIPTKTFKMRFISELSQVEVERDSVRGGTAKMVFTIDPKSFLIGMVAWRQGALIQDAFPALSVDEREFLLTGMLPEDWKEYYGKDEFNEM